MRHRELGKTGLRLSELCFGPMRFAAKQPGDDATSKRGVAALHAALALGIDTIHSSVDYGTQWALGRALESHPKRHDVHHVIKVQTPDYEDDRFDPTAFEATVDQALRALHAERIAIVQHLQRGPHVTKEEVYTSAADARRLQAAADVNAALADTFNALRARGKVGHLVTFPHTMGFAGPAIESGCFQGVAHYLNLLESEAVPLLDDLERRGLGFIAIRPLLQGLLCNARRHRESLPPADKRRRDNWAPLYALWDQITPLLRELGQDTSSWSAYALKFCLAHPAVTTLVTGMNSPAQVEALAAALETPDVDREVQTAVHRLTASLPAIPKSSIFG